MVVALTVPVFSLMWYHATTTMSQRTGWTQSVSRQLARNGRANLLRDGAPDDLEIGGEFVDALNRFAATAPDDLDIREASADAARRFLSAVLAINPYVELDASDRRRVQAVYRDSAERILAGEPVDRVLRSAHYPALRTWLAAKYPDSVRIGLQDRYVLGQITYAESPPHLQLRVLGLDSRRIAGRVLDLGCGRDAALVRYLAEAGVEAVGVDRSLDRQEDFLVPTSWFDYPLEPDAFDLIVSHLAFSSHALYQLNTDGPECDRYLARYGDILGALRVGASFVYAPSLPQWEERLSAARFTVERWAVGSGDGTTASAVVRSAATSSEPGEQIV